MTALAVSAMLAALLGSGHCAAMCGAFACASADVAPGVGGRIRGATAYNLGRLLSYLALGAAAGTIGAGVNAAASLQEAVRPAALAGGTLLVAWGAARLLELAGVRTPDVRPPGWTRRAMSGGMRVVAARPPVTRAIVVGALAPLLPCGWLYAFVASAASTGSTGGGIAVMAGFWVGSVPALGAVALGLHRLLGPARRFMPVATAVALIVVGSLTLARGIGMTPPLHMHHLPSP